VRQVGYLQSTAMFGTKHTVYMTLTVKNRYIHPRHSPTGLLDQSTVFSARYELYIHTQRTFILVFRELSALPPMLLYILVSD